MGLLQPWHLIIVLVIILVVFGPGKLPMLGKAVGDSMRDFKKAIGDHSPKDTVAELPPGTRACPTCQKPVAIADRFCGACGARSDVTTAA
jgi:TatA/E family protein of Tat protein translocase